MHRIAETFRHRFGTTPRVFKAPGRVNLIGEHTDYNDGFVMPVAISFATSVAITARSDQLLRIHAASFGDTCTVDLRGPLSARRHWSDYIVGVALALRATGVPVKGADMLIESNVPMGAGLSSSAALEVACGFALATTSGVAIDRVTLARIGQSAENDFVGMRCGIMDQFVSSCAEEGRALKLDCRTLAYETVPLPSRAAIVIVNSMVKHELSGSAYNERRAQCEESVRIIKRDNPTVTALRDVAPAMLARCEGQLPPLLLQRSRHVVSENERVQAAAGALQIDGLERVGELMWASHASLRDDYEVSCRELDDLVALAKEAPGVFGSRMTGGGFGGCTVSLVATANADGFARHMKEAYAAKGYPTPDVFVCVPSQGVHEVTQ